MAVPLTATGAGHDPDAAGHGWRSAALRARCGPSPGERVVDQEHDDRAHDRSDDPRRCEPPILAAAPEEHIDQEAPDERAGDPEEDRGDEAHGVASRHDGASQKSGHDAHQEKADEKTDHGRLHSVVPAGVSGTSLTRFSDSPSPPAERIVEIFSPGATADEVKRGLRSDAEHPADLRGCASPATAARPSPPARSSAGRRSAPAPRTSGYRGLRCRAPPPGRVREIRRRHALRPSA